MHSIQLMLICLLNINKTYVFMKVPWLFPSENAIPFYNSLSVFYKDHNKKYSLIKLGHFSESSFGETCSHSLTTSSYMELVSN